MKNPPSQRLRREKLKREEEKKGLRGDCFLERIAAFAKTRPLLALS